MNFREQVLEVIAEACEDEIVKENPEIEIFEEGLLDSFGVVNLLMLITEKLGIDVAISEFDRDEWRTPNLIVEKLEEKHDL
jgi:D-alanine--poly(phosphoribitol) ligase subunit 2